MLMPETYAWKNGMFREVCKEGIQGVGEVKEREGGNRYNVYLLVPVQNLTHLMVSENLLLMKLLF